MVNQGGDVNEAKGGDRRGGMFSCQAETCVYVCVDRGRASDFDAETPLHPSYPFPHLFLGRKRFSFTPSIVTHSSQAVHIEFKAQTPSHQTFFVLVLIRRGYIDSG